MDNSISVFFGPKDFHNQTRVFGRMSANYGLLKALILYGNQDNLSLYIEHLKYFNEFKQGFASELNSSRKSVHPIVYGDIPALQQTGLYLRTDPMLSQMSWARNFLNPAAFSLCGLTHSVSDLSFPEEVGKLIVAPMKQWDALVCTSTAVKTVVENVFEQWLEYLYAQHQAKLQFTIQLPVIPLGIHPDDVATTGEVRELKRKKFRERYGIKENDFVVLFFGRLFFYEKAHPIPTYLALEKLAQRVGSKNQVHFVQAGWFDDSQDLQHYKASAKLFCPSVNCIFINKIDTDDKKLSIWPGADVFISLSDNFQESFGITPLEAMANQLPVVVSDWNGYKDTVRHEVDGFLVPTTLPPAGCGTDLSLGYLTQAINYKTFSGLNAQMTAVDVDYCSEVLWQLYQLPDLRRRMGASGFQHINERFHWMQVIKEYKALWDDLTARRLTAISNEKKAIAKPPILADSYLTFSDYATETLKSTHHLKPGGTPLEQLHQLAANYLGNFGAQQRLSLVHLEKIVLEVKNKMLTVQQIVELMRAVDNTISSGVIVRSLIYLLKYNFLKINVIS